MHHPYYYETMKTIFYSLLIILILATAGCIEETTTPAEEKTDTFFQKGDVASFVNDAVNLIEERGEEAFPEFRKKDSRWFHDDSYVFVWRTDGIRVVYPPNMSREGQNVSGLEDYHGKPIGKLFMDIATSEEGEGWVGYDWPKPGELKPSRKYTLIKRAVSNGQTYVIGSGFYLDDYLVIRDIKDCEYLSLLDNNSICEFLHPGRVDRELGIDYSIAHIIIRPGKTIPPHRMKNPEVHYILKGEGILHIEDVPVEVHQGQIVHIPANSKQSLENTGNSDLEIFAINQPAWSEENQETD